MVFGITAILPQDEIEQKFGDPSAHINGANTSAKDREIDRVYPGLVAFAAVLVPIDILSFVHQGN